MEDATKVIPKQGIPGRVRLPSENGAAMTQVINPYVPVDQRNYADRQAGLARAKTAKKAYDRGNTGFHVGKGEMYAYILVMIGMIIITFTSAFLFIASSIDRSAIC